MTSKKIFVSAEFELFKSRMIHPLRYRAFMLMNLPAAFFAGIKVLSISEETATVSVKQKWFNKNPFRSIYFAVLSMAAELSTGILCLGNIYSQHAKVSMLIVKMESVFHKKATGKIMFTCADGAAIQSAIKDAIVTKEARTISCHSFGKNDKGDTVADFYITWSFKARG